MTKNYVITTAKGWKHDVRANSHMEAGARFLSEHPDEESVKMQSEEEAIAASLDKGFE